eukprot:scaffold1459_cov260-Pinguiococcus_pyrenoidosus.AAC.13
MASVRFVQANDVWSLEFASVRSSSGLERHLSVRILSRPAQDPIVRCGGRSRKVRGMRPLDLK